MARDNRQWLWCMEKAIGEDGLGVSDPTRVGMSSNADEVGEEGIGPDLSIEEDGDGLGATIDYQSQRRRSQPMSITGLSCEGMYQASGE
ncbi:hypothetical protein ACLOJK_020874 [Asimina triloba]